MDTTHTRASILRLPSTEYGQHADETNSAVVHLGSLGSSQLGEKTIDDKVFLDPNTYSVELLEEGRNHTTSTGELSGHIGVAGFTKRSDGSVATFTSFHDAAVCDTESINQQMRNFVEEQTGETITPVYFLVGCGLGADDNSSPVHDLANSLGDTARVLFLPHGANNDYTIASGRSNDGQQGVFLNGLKIDFDTYLSPECSANFLDPEVIYSPAEMERLKKDIKELYKNDNQNEGFQLSEYTDQKGNEVLILKGSSYVGGDICACYIVIFPDKIALVTTTNNTTNSQGLYLDPSSWQSLCEHAEAVCRDLLSKDKLEQSLKDELNDIDNMSPNELKIQVMLHRIFREKRSLSSSHTQTQEDLNRSKDLHQIIDSIKPNPKSYDKDGWLINLPKPETPITLQDFESCIGYLKQLAKSRLEGRSVEDGTVYHDGPITPRVVRRFLALRH